MPRLKIRFGSSEAYDQARSTHGAAVRVAVASRARGFLSVDLPDAAPEIALFSESQIGRMVDDFGAQVVEDYRFEMEANPFAPLAGAEAPASATLDDVVTQVRADRAWASTRGQGVTIAIVDTGIDGTRAEFPASKKAGAWQPAGETPWTDWEGHGTMCAAIAAGTTAAGGTRNGIAPDAQLIACKTYFYDSELTAAYDYLTALAKAGSVIVASNSFGIKTGTPPPPPAATDVGDALRDALDAGIIAVFSAGNYHDLTTGQANGCAPTSIWLHKCRSDVLTVGTCKLDETMWHYSSRGPGQHFGDPGTARKPDVIAPTPANGLIAYGSADRVLPIGWGTSGACPQVAGLAALLLAWRPTLAPVAVRDAIRDTARSVGLGADCQGSGIIDCEAAVNAVA